MLLLISCILALTSLCRGYENTATFYPYELGEHDVSIVRLSYLTSMGLEENLEVWVPKEPGTYPVFYYLDGFGGGIPADGYNQTMKHIASYGYTVVLAWKILAPLNPNEKVPMFASVLEWAEDHLEKRLHNKGVDPDVHLDMENLIIGGHSAGAHISVEYMKGTCGKFKGQVLMDPVDGADPLGLIPVYCITPGEILNFNTPTLILSAGLDSVPGASGFACAPEDLSNDRFYNALDPSTQRWMINATEFGHADFLDPFFLESLFTSEVCYYNKNATMEDFATYRRYIAGQTVTFLKALFSEGACTEYLSYLEDPASMIVATEQKHVNPVGGCPVAACTWTPMPNTTTTAEPLDF